MREILDRLREATTALDNELNELYYARPIAEQVRAINLIWKAKQSLWWTQMHVLNAAASAGSIICDDP